MRKTNGAFALRARRFICTRWRVSCYRGREVSATVRTPRILFAALAVASAVLLQPISPAAQVGAPAASGITLDFVAAGPDGQAITDLSPADITLKVNGKVRSVTSLEVVSPSERGRSILLLVDEATLYGLEPVLKDAVSQLVASLGPGDRIAYVSTRRGRITTLTPDHSTVARAMGAMVTGPGILWTCLSDLVTSMEALTKTLPRGRSTTLVVLSRGSMYDPSFGTDSGGSGCTPRTTALRHLGEVISAAQINVQLLTVDHLNRSWGLDTLARNTGGISGLVTWSDPGALDRAVASTSHYYRASFAADDKANDRPQRLELRVNRPKVKVQTSPTILLKSPRV